MSDRWYYRLMGEKLGPISSSELKQLAESGKVAPDTVVRKGLDGDWVLAEKVRGLFEPPSKSLETQPQTAPQSLAPSAQHAPVDEPSEPIEGAKTPESSAARECPSCQARISPKAVICLHCGLDLRTGQTASGAYKKDRLDGPSWVGVAQVQSERRSQYVGIVWLAGAVLAVVGMWLGIDLLNVSGGGSDNGEDAISPAPVVAPPVPTPSEVTPTPQKPPFELVPGEDFPGGTIMRMRSVPDSETKIAIRFKEGIGYVEKLQVSLKRQGYYEYEIRPRGAQAILLKPKPMRGDVFQPDFTWIDQPYDIVSRGKVVYSHPPAKTGQGN